MAIIKGNLASVAWSGSGLDLSTMTLGEFTLTETGTEIDGTGFGDLEKVIAAGPTGWGVSMTGIYPAAVRSAHIGGLTFSSGYVIGCNAFSLSIGCAFEETTALGVGVRSYTPVGPLMVSGSFDVQIDSATKLAALTAANADLSSTAAVFSFDTSDATDQIEVNIATLGLTTSIARTGNSGGTYAFTGTSTIDMNTTILSSAGNLALPTAGEWTGTAITNMTYVGDAFWTGIDFRVAVGDAPRVTIAGQGTGALTKNQPA
jgi:hypothetical protein